MTKKRGAARGELSDLHMMLAKYFKGRLQDAMPDEDGNVEVTEFDEEGNPIGTFKMPLSSAEIGNIITFLKHNDITAEPDDEALSELKDEFKADLERKRADKAASVIHATADDAERASWLN